MQFSMRNELKLNVKIMSDNDTSSDSDCNDGPVVKKGKFSGAAKYCSRFKKEWIAKYPFLSSDSTDVSKFRCNVCSKTLLCAHQGEADVKRHISSNTHVAMAKTKIKQPAITSMFMQPNSDLSEKVNIFLYLLRIFDCIIICNVFLLYILKVFTSKKRY